MKPIILSVILIALPGAYGRCQTIDYKKIIIPENAKNLSIEEKLVQLAWQNNPQTEIVRKNVDIADKNVKMARWSWLDQIQVRGNLNEFTIDPSSTDRSYFYPRYNFSIGFSLGVFAELPLQVRQAREQKDIAEQEINLQKLQIRHDVLESYDTYKLNEQILRIRSSATEDAYAKYRLLEKKFENGEVSLELYNQSMERYNDQKIQQLNAEHNLNVAKLQLEQLIGVNLEDVL